MNPCGGLECWDRYGQCPGGSRTPCGGGVGDSFRCGSRVLGGR